MPDWSAELELAVRAARTAGDLLRGPGGALRTADSAEGKDIKLQADREAEAAILRILGESAHPHLAEESGASDRLDARAPFWVVDPLDGTYNYKRRIDFCAVSIALVQGETPLLGVIYDFHRDRLYAGAEGIAPTVSGEPLAVSTVADRGQAVIATGFPVGRDFADGPVLDFVRRVQSFKKIRLLGTAALTLALVAEGKLDCYYEEGINLWDVAAGLALVRLAGGRLQLTPTDTPFRYDAYAGNAVLPPIGP
ncbi:MAG: inositol monophosphatase family protein [Verrucomicrobiota bacterium]